MSNILYIILIIYIMEEKSILKNLGCFMKKEKLKLIEAYVYAKTLNQISNNTISVCDNQINSMIEKTKQLSSTLLKNCEQKIIDLNLDNLSFKILKKELETANYKNSFYVNFEKMTSMLENYTHYNNLIAQQ
jgi:hypothetical protein